MKQQQEDGFSVVSLDESFFFYDSLVRRVWIDEKTYCQSNRLSQAFMSVWSRMSMEGKQLFRQYERFNGDTFLDFLKLIHNKFPKCYLFMDKRHRHTTDQER